MHQIPDTGKQEHNAKDELRHAGIVASSVEKGGEPDGRKHRPGQDRDHGDYQPVPCCCFHSFSLSLLTRAESQRTMFFR